MFSGGTERAKYEQTCNFIKKETLAACNFTLAQMFSCEFVKFLRTPFLQNISGQLPLGLDDLA